jgi:hypothetical protein
MKKTSCLIFSVAAAVLLGIGGCTKKSNGPPPVSSNDLKLTGIATALKTASGKTVDAYEVNFSNNTSSVILVVDGGKLEKSTPCPLLFEGGPLMLDFAGLQNQVAVVKKGRPMVFMDGVTPVDAKAKCTPGKPLNLPVDKTLEKSLSLQ